MLACSFLIESSSKLLVTRTGIKAWSSSISGRIRPLILELLALEWRKFHTFELEYLWSQLANLDQILCVASLGLGKGCIRFWGRLTLAHWTQVSNRCPLGYLLRFLPINDRLLLIMTENDVNSPINNDPMEKRNKFINHLSYYHEGIYLASLSKPCQVDDRILNLHQTVILDFVYL